METVSLKTQFAKAKAIAKTLSTNGKTEKLKKEKGVVERRGEELSSLPPPRELEKSQKGRILT
jgi:hypothetical protein